MAASRSLFVMGFSPSASNVAKAGQIGTLLFRMCADGQNGGVLESYFGTFVRLVDVAVLIKLPSPYLRWAQNVLLTLNRRGEFAMHFCLTIHSPSSQQYFGQSDNKSAGSSQKSD